ncbi:acyl-CoA dehydrogenase family protein [Pseudoalteromonas ardens]|nr:acyl-CoA dehydrogenase family protein [Pseudoalteromonas sp. R96]MDK1310222.1 acyl-CoA dehydrogenase family protein [Pseudoalteromonas sp. R96]
MKAFTLKIFIKDCSIMNSFNHSSLPVLAPLEQFYALTREYELSELESMTPAQIKALISSTQLPSMIVPKEFGGLEMPMKDALEVVYSVAMICPSAALMLCMHFHVVSTISMYPNSFQFAGPLLKDISENNALVASAFAESSGNQDIFHTSVAATSTEEDYIIISGSKKPCTMSHVADYFAVSIITAEGIPGVAIVSNGSEGLERKPFWPGDILKSTDSHEVIFNNVIVPNEWSVLAQDDSFEMYLSTGLVNFNLFIGAAYTGVCKSLVGRLNPAALQAPSIFIPVTGTLAQCRYSVCGLSHKVAPENLEWLVPEVLSLRYQIQKSLKDVRNIVFESIGAHKYLSDDTAHYLSRTIDLLAFHPVTQFGFEQQLKN